MIEIEAWINEFKTRRRGRKLKNSGTSELLFDKRLQTHILCINEIMTKSPKILKNCS